MTGQYDWIQWFPNRTGWYVNPGLSCHAFNPKTFALMQSFQGFLTHSIKEKMFGWGQVAYNALFCSSRFNFLNPDAAAYSLKNKKMTWRGQVVEHNVSVYLYNAASTDDESMSDVDRKSIPAFHPKSCHLNGMDDSVARVQCKVNWLKKQDQWFLPNDIPVTIDGWLAVNNSLVDHIRYLLHTH
jgi:hypothetical protein